MALSDEEYYKLTPEEQVMFWRTTALNREMRVRWKPFPEGC